MIRTSIIILMIPMIFSGCSGCSKSGRFKKKNDGSQPAEVASSNRQFFGKSIIKMTKENGVYKIPVLINGLNMVFIFDTGAGLISISNVEASYLYKQGKLTKEDILGKAEFIDANGDISVGTIIKLKEVTIGNRTIYNINASVVDNSIAPLLFGQSALEQFGKISIDYNNNTVTFE
jgi:aspartyl protease family protein